MAIENVPKTVEDAINDFDLQHTCAASLVHILADIVDDAKFECSLSMGDPWHPAQRAFACITSIQAQLKAIECTVHAIPTLATA